MRRGSLAEMVPESVEGQAAGSDVVAVRSADHRVHLRAAARVRRRGRGGASRRGDAARHGPGRADPAARRPGPRELGLPDRGPAGPGDHPDRNDHRHSRRASWRTCSPPIWPSSRTSIAGSTPRATPGRQSPARPARTGSPSTSRVGAWGNRDVRDRSALRGGRVRRLLPALVAGGDPRSRSPRTPAVRGADRRPEHPDPSRADDDVRARSERMAWWPLGRSRREPTAGDASTAASTASPVAAPASLPAEPAGAWRDLPSLQRTLAEPLRPVAVGDDFRQSLASFNDPSFVAPLSHHVDPSTGGLVDGLAAPGQPYAHPNAAELPVPARPAGSVRSAGAAECGVEWFDGSADGQLGTARGCRPTQPVEPSPESPVTSSQGEPSVPIPAPASGAGPVSPAAPQTPVPVQRSLAAVPMSPAPKGVVPPISRGELPVVVARSTPDESTAEVQAPEIQAATPDRCRDVRPDPRPSKPRSADLLRRSPGWVARTRSRPSRRSDRRARIGPSPARRFSD